VHVDGLPNKQTVQPVEYHKSNRAQVVPLAERICSFVRGELSQTHIHAPLADIGIDFVRLPY
jgi:hypothetical protein